MEPIPVRVTVLDTWEEVALNVPASVTVADVKARVLSQARIRQPASDYLMKFRGAEIPEGATTMAEAGIVPNAGLIVMLRRRSAVR